MSKPLASFLTLDELLSLPEASFFSFCKTVVVNSRDGRDKQNSTLNVLQKDALEQGSQNGL